MSNKPKEFKPFKSYNLKSISFNIAKKIKGNMSKFEAVEFVPKNGNVVTEKDLTYIMMPKQILEEEIEKHLISKLKQQQQEIIKLLEKEKDKLYCTAEHLGYHDKNCSGACEKEGYKEAIKLIKDKE